MAKTWHFEGASLGPLCFHTSNTSTSFGAFGVQCSQILLRLFQIAKRITARCRHELILRSADRMQETRPFSSAERS